MKKILSILLSVMLILGTLSVLMMLPASATTGSENAVGPVNLIVNGDGVGTPYYSAEDGAPNLEDYTDASWQDIGKYFTYNNANGAVSYYPVGWRTTGTQYANLDYRSLRNQYVNNVDKYTYTSYDDPADPYALSVNALQQAYQDFVIEAGKYYTVSADLTVVPTFFEPEDSNADGDLTAEYEAWISTWTADMFVDTLCWGNEGELDISETGITTHKTGRNPSGKVPTGYDWNLVNTDEERAAINAHLQSGMGKGFTAADGKVYHNSGDFKTYSFTFSADEFIAANSGIKNNGDGTYTVRLVIRNGISQTRLAFDNVMVYECAAVEATSGGFIVDNATGEAVDVLTCDPGTEVSVTATAYYGNSFIGWYQGETPVSTELTYTGTITGSLVAKFNNYNLITDGNFESGTNNFITDINPDSLYSASTYPRKLEVIDAPTGTDAAVHGNKVLSATFDTETNPGGHVSRDLLAIPVTIEPNSSYAFSYSVYWNNSAKDYIQTAISTTNHWWLAAGTCPMATWSFHESLETKGYGVDTTSWRYKKGTNSQLQIWDTNLANSVKTWFKADSYITTGAQDAAPFNGNDSVTVYIVIGTQGLSTTEVDNIYLDNILFAKTTDTAPAAVTATATATAGGTVETVDATEDAIAVYDVTAHSTYTATDLNTPHYANISRGHITATATPNWGAKFTGWTRDGAAYSTEPTITVSDTSAYVANFTGNVIANGDFSDDDTSAIVVESGANTATVMTEGTGESANSYVRLKSEKTGNQFTPFKWNFDVTKGNKYVVSYKLRSPIDENGEIMSTTNHQYGHPMVYLGIRPLVDSSPVWTNINTSLASTHEGVVAPERRVSGTKNSYTNTAVTLNSTSLYVPKDNVGTDANATVLNLHYNNSLSWYNVQDGDWLTYTYVIDATEIWYKNAGADVDLFANSNDATLAITFGFPSNTVGYLDIDDISVTEYNANTYEYAVGRANNGTETISTHIADAGVPVTYTAVPDEGYEFAGWYDSSNALVSDSAVYSVTSGTVGAVYTLTPKFTEVATETEVVVNSDFEDGTIPSAYTYTSTSSAVIADHDTAAEDYTADLGSKYLKVTNMTDDNAHCDFAIPVNVTAGKKTVVHFKAKALSYNAEENTEDSNAGARWDIRVDNVANGWSIAKNVSGKIVVSDSEGTAWNRSYDAWHQYPKTDGDGNPVYEEDGETPVMVTAGGVSAGTTSDIGLADNYNDVYVMLDATADQTVYVHFGYRNGAEFAIDNVWVYDEDELVSLNGATPDVDIDDNQKIAYVTELKFPAGLATNKISTYVAPYTRLSQDAPDYLYNFTDELNADFAELGEPRIVSKARVTADESGLIMNEGVAFTNGKTYAEFDMGDTFNYTTKYAVRSEIALADIYGNDLGFTISTNNGEEGLYVRSANQLKRIIAKALISEKEVMPFDIEITPVDGKSRWNADITQVWKFVLKYKNHLG